MSEALIVIDGQIPVPDDVRERMGLHPGTRVQLRLVDDRTLMVETVTAPSVTRLFGMFKIDRPLSLEEMEQAIAEGATNE